MICISHQNLCCLYLKKTTIIHILGETFLLELYINHTSILMIHVYNSFKTINQQYEPENFHVIIHSINKGGVTI